MEGKKNYRNKLLKLEALIVACVFLLSALSILSGADERKGTISNDYSVMVTRTDTFGVDVSLSINDFSTEIIEANTIMYERLKLQSGGFTAEYGKAELPTISFYVAIPKEAKVSLDYETSDFILLQDYNIYPSQPPKPETDGYIDPPFTKNESFYSTNEYYPSSVVQVSPIKTIRGCRFVMVSVFPFTYNPATKTLKVYNDISISIDFIGGTGEFIPERLRSIYYQPLLDAFLVNSNIVERAKLNNPQSTGGRLSEEDRADLLIVVYDDFYEEILPLAEWRHATGIETKVVKWSDIGSTSTELRSYVHSAYNDWELPPSFLLIVGDADHVPVNYIYNHPYHGSNTGTDLWYVANDDTDYFPFMHEGRISVDNEAELITVVNKILDYSKTPYMGSNWFNNVLLAAKEESGRYFVWGSETVYNFLNPLGYNVIRQYQGGTPPGSTQGVIDAIDNGVIIANHRDHGACENDGYSYTGWSAPRFDTTNILNDIDNGEMYPVMFSLNCDSGWFDGETDINSGNYESIGEVGIRVPNGFIAVVAHTRVSYSGYNDEIGRGHYDAMFSDFDPAYPTGGSTNPFSTEVYRISQVMNYAKFWMYDKYVAPGGCSPYPWTPNEQISRITFEMLHVHGDPTTDIWLAFPQDLTVDHPIMVQYGPSIYEVTVESDGNPIEGALVCMNQPNGVYAKGLTDSSGVAELELDIELPDEVILTVTAHNHLYYQSNIQVGSSYPPYPPTIEGTAVGKPEKEYEYTSVTTDPEDDQILYLFDWGDGTASDWLGPYNSGESVTAPHAWPAVGDYEIKVRAKDIEGSIGYWSDPFPLHIDLPALDVGLIKGGLAKVSVAIKNTGLAEADDINWQITLDGGLILLGKETTGTIQTILAGEEEEVRSGLIFGFGQTRVTVTADILEGLGVRNQGAFVLLFFISVLPGGG